MPLDQGPIDTTSPRVIQVDEVCGIVSGVTGNPAILSYASKLAGTDKPDVGYAMIFPGATIMKILFVQIAAAIWGG